MTAAEKYLPILQAVENDYQCSHPYWRAEVLVSLIKWGLKCLQHRIERSRAGRITWEQPFVELHYPVEWNWKQRAAGDVVPTGHICGRITEKNTRSRKEATRTLCKIMACRLNAIALSEATNWVRFEKSGNRYTQVLPVDVCAKLNAIKNKRERQKALEAVTRPFSIGAALIDYGDMELRNGARVSKRVAKELAGIDDLIDITRIAFKAEINGREIEQAVVFQIHPLIADYDKRKAYHQITVGLFATPQELGNEFVMPSPAGWPQSDREQLWKKIFEGVDQLVGKLIPEAESQESVILNVNAQLKVPARNWRPENTSETIKHITDAYLGLGELVSFGIQTADTGNGRNSMTVCAVCGWGHDSGFTQIRLADAEPLSLHGVLPKIVRLVHRAHERGFNGLSTKDAELLDTCGGYGNPCKAFDDLKRRREYKLIFDTSRRGLLSLRGAIGRNRKESEPGPE